MALLDFYIRNQKLSKIGPKLVADSVNYVDCSFTFRTDDWNGIDKWIVFSKGEESYRVNLVDDSIPEEAGLNLGAGLWFVSLFGENPDGTKRITTNSVTVEVAKSAVPKGGPLPVIELTEAEQIAAKAQKAMDTANEVLLKAENGDFDGKPGEPGKDGENATPEQIAEAVENYFEENPIPGGGNAEVTAENIKKALGYVPANEEDIPTVPTDVSAFNNDAGYAKKTELPAKTSDLTNDSGYITKEDIPAAPEVPVKSVFGRTGTVVAQSGDYTAEMVGADEAGKAVEEVGKHNVDENAHNDIRVELTELRNALEAFLDIDDPTLDQLSELIQKIEANAETITELTNGKVNISDIVNNLTTNVVNKPLSAAQGVVLKGLVNELDTIAKGAASTAETAKTTADEAKNLATTADTNAKNASDEVADLKERMDSGEFKGADGKSAYQYAVEKGYGGSESEFAELMAKEPLTGTTTEVIPVQVSAAMLEGRPVAITHMDNSYGQLVFNYFAVNDLLNGIVASIIFQVAGTVFCAQLDGSLSTNSWSLKVVTLAKPSDIPEIPDYLPNQYYLLFTGAVNGMYNGASQVEINIPTALPNPNALTFTGAVSGTYDGSSAKIINIPTIAGEKGEDGVSIASVTQTTTSTADDGENVVTVTLSDGTTSTFTIKNGSKGSTGATGPEGPAGADGKDAEDAIPGYVREEAERVAAVVQSRQNENTISFFACSDLHYSQIQSHAPQQLAAMTHMGQGMKLIREKVKIDFGVMLGDMIWDVGETNETGLEEIRFVNECLSNGFGNLPQFRSRGNHENGYESGADFSKSQIFANIGIFNKGAVYDDTNRIAGYCYWDFEDAKLRVINLNSSEEGGCWFSPAQVSWLANALDLSAKGSGWRSIVLSHHPIDWGKSGGVDPTSTLKNAKGVIATFHGHIHNFLVGTLTGTELKRIAIPNAGYTRENQYGTSYNINWKDTTTYSKTTGTAEDTSFCVITIDLGAKKIYADHYGAGCDRVITYDDVVLESYTVTNNLTNVSNSSNITAVDEGGSYSATLTAYEGYELDAVTVTMGGTNITSAAYSAGKITIASVTGDIVITATAKEAEAAPSYTNLVPTSIDPATGAVYNASDTPGYKNGKYASGGSEGTDAAYVLTGLIAYGNRISTPIYIKGADVTSESHCRILGFDASRGASFQSAAGSALATYFTVETLNASTKYYKVTPTSSWVGKTGNSDYIRLSLKGTGENLIITLNEPIE